MRKLAFCALLLALVALPAAAATDPLALVPPDATAVGMLRLADVRTSPWAPRLFSEADRATMDGDAARFLADAHLKPTEDLDTIVFAALPARDGAHGSGVAILEGRFDAASVEAALVARGAVKRSVAGGALLILPENDAHPHGGEPGALAFLDRHLAVAGPQPAVESVLARAASGARSDFRTGAGLGRQLHRVPTDATGWVLVDLSRQAARVKAHEAEAHAHAEAGEEGARQLMQVSSLVKQVPLLAMSATLRPDAMTLTAFGQCDDAETRGDLEDSLRGLLAAWRLSVQDAKPDLLPVIRSFKVTQGKDGVSLSGKVPGAALASFFEKAQAHAHEAH